MIELNVDESRVLGVLIEKALTTPEQYPLSLNALTNGANQKNNRDPVLSMTEDQVFDAVESLRDKGLVVRVDQIGSRVSKFRHEVGTKLNARTGEVAILAELLLRGPQTMGELRGRASRMHPMETMDTTRDLLRAMMERTEPLVKVLPPSPGSRAERYVQLLCPDLHPVDTRDSAAPTAAVPQVAGADDDRIAKLEAEVERLKAAIRKLAAGLGEADPLGDSV